MSRRTFLQIAAGGAAALAAGLDIAAGETAAGKRYDRYVASAHPPGDNRPEVLSTYVTTCRECPAGCGMYVTHSNGRVLKCEGNPTWPVNTGTLCPRGQSAVQGLYDPDRLRAVRQGGATSAAAPGWAAAFEQIGAALKSANGHVAIVSGLETLSLARLMEEFLKAFGSDRLHFFEPFNYQPLREAHQELFGLPLVPHYQLDACDCLISFGADFLESWISPVEFVRAYGRMRSVGDGHAGWMTYVGPRLSQTACNADQFVLTRSGEELHVALALLESLLRQKLAKNDISFVRPALDALADKLQRPAGLETEQVDELAKAFATAKASAALAGPVGSFGWAARQTATAAALLNYACGRVGQTVDFAHPHALSRSATREGFQAFLSGITGSDVVIVANCNPVYALPGCRDDLRRAGKIIYLGCNADETSQIADWLLPVDSPLESWGDYQPYDGIRGLIQPAMSRMYDTRLTGDVLLALADAAGKPVTLPKTNQPVTSFQDWLKAGWSEIAGHVAQPPPAVAGAWASCLRAGGLVDADGANKPVHLVARSLDFRVPEKVGIADRTPADSTQPAATTSALAADSAELWLYANSLLHDGRVANRGWIQEIPDPVSQIVWGNWVDIHPGKARQLGVRDFDVLELTGPGGKIEVPARLTSQVHPECVSVLLGQGHWATGMATARYGGNAFALIGNRGDGGFGRVTLRKTGQRKEWVGLSPTQEQFGREVLQWDSLEELRHREKPEEISLPLPEGYDSQRDLYPKRHYKKHRWAMVVDLEKCVGCGACIAACYAENNLAVMGSVNCHDGREMAWLKVVPYRFEHLASEKARAGLPNIPTSSRPSVGWVEERSDEAHLAPAAEGGPRKQRSTQPTIRSLSSGHSGSLPALRETAGVAQGASDRPNGSVPAAGRVGFLPLPCQHCDAAPCEPVCPVFAAVHNEEGLNAQVYNRCIGTRYCSNNCPYKVRRFNWFDASWKPPLDWQLNPDVSVRVRGVMEKCTFCIQRIHRVELQAKLEGRNVRDGEVVPACVQTCPSGVYTFGDLLDPASKVSLLTRLELRRYQVLGELNTKPAVTYLRKVVVEHPDAGETPATHVVQPPSAVDPLTEERA